MSEDMRHRSCTPCRGGIPPLGAEEVQTYLADRPDWQASEDAKRIERRLRFADFKSALDFVNEVGVIAEAEGHHPDIRFGWGYATITLQTHKIGGLHENDFIMAAKIDGLVHAD